MLGESRETLIAIQRQQRYQTELQREALVKINLVLERQVAPTPVLAALGEPEDEDLAPAPGPCPYKGLAAFQADDAKWFFGRERLIAELAPFSALFCV